jgi:hypothetical protein
VNRASFKTVLRRDHRAFTLLEVMLAMGLSALVLIFVAMAIDIHLRLINSNRTGVEEAHLARALLDRIADDLSNAVLYNPIDVEKLVPDLTSQGGAGGGAAGGGAAAGGAAPGGTAAGGTGTGGTGAGGTGTGGTATGGATTGAAATGGTQAGGVSGGATASATGQTSNLAGSTTPQSTPGLYGNAYQLQVDTSRLPRADELQAALPDEGTAVTALVGDVKTVAYYVLSDQQSGVGYASSVPQNGSGLVRLEFDRATATFAAAQGQLIDADQNVEPIAPEVAAIEFQYYDGTGWYEEWDSAARGGLPVAVEIAIGIIPARRRTDTQSASLRTTIPASLTENGEWLIYRRVVYLPVAQPTTLEGASTTSGASSEESAAGASGGSTAAGSAPTAATAPIAGGSGQ